jgi:hypothetical protein
MVLRPDRQTLLMVVACTDMGMPPRTAACRAVIWPWPAWSTWPMSTSSTSAGATPARRSASAMAKPPSCIAVKPDSAPDSFPMGVRAPATMTDVDTANLLASSRAT